MARPPRPFRSGSDRQRPIRYFRPVRLDCGKGWECIREGDPDYFFGTQCDDAFPGGRTYIPN